MVCGNAYICLKLRPMKKWIFLPIALIGMAFMPAEELTSGCQGYMLMEKGVTLVYSDFDAKDKLQGTQTNTIKEITETGGVLKVTMHTISKDAKDKVQSEGDFSFTCENGVIKMDMKSFTNQGMSEGMEGMEIAIDQTDLVYPATLKEGEVLPDGEMTMTVSSGGMQVMKMVTKITERKVEKMESKTTTAGTFDCVRTSQMMSTEMMGRTTKMKSISWISLNVGMVRTETYNEDGTLNNVHVLTQIIK
jgi:hypothetical protein